MSLLDGIDVLEDRLGQHVEELSRELIYEFAKDHCRYNVFRRGDDGTFWVCNNEYFTDYSYSSFVPNAVECSQVEIFDGDELRIYPIDVNYPILIEDWNEPTLPRYIRFFFPPSEGFATEYDHRSGEFNVYSRKILNGSIVLLNCHPDLLRGDNELVRMGINIIRLDHVTNG